jgi:hypothetical protein
MKKTIGDTIMRMKEGRTWLPLAAFFIFVFLLHGTASFAQRLPGYSFVDFDKSYEYIEENARSGGYEVRREELISRYGRSSLTLEKGGKFYAENIYLFFDDTGRLLFFTVSLDLNEGQSKIVIDRLVTEIVGKFEMEYGESEKDTVPYYRVVEGGYEVFVRPVTATTVSCVVTFRHIPRYDEYGKYYSAEVLHEVEEEIEKTVEKF